MGLYGFIFFRDNAWVTIIVRIHFFLLFDPPSNTNPFSLPACCIPASRHFVNSNPANKSYTITTRKPTTSRRAKAANPFILRNQGRQARHGPRISLLTVHQYYNWILDLDRRDNALFMDSCTVFFRGFQLVLGRSWCCRVRFPQSRSGVPGPSHCR